MIRLILLIFFTTLVTGQSEFNGKCPTTTSDVDPFNWDDFAPNIWYEMYRSDKSQDIECVQVIYERMGTRYMVHYAGRKGSQDTMWHDYASVTGVSTYTLIDRVQTVVAFKKGSYAVVHECVNTGDSNRQTYTWILSSGTSLSSSDKSEIEMTLKSKGLDEQIKIGEMTETNQPSDCKY